MGTKKITPQAKCPSISKTKSNEYQRGRQGFPKYLITNLKPEVYNQLHFRVCSQTPSLLCKKIPDETINWSKGKGKLREGIS